MDQLLDHPDRQPPLRLCGKLVSVLAQRPFRVLLLGVAIAAMSGVDLYLTLLYVTHIGMTELNPIARAMMDYQSPLLLAVWKTATVVLSVGILLLIRKQRSAEIGAWAGCLVLGWLMSHWVVFVHETRNIDIEVAHAMGANDPSWVMIGGAQTGVLPTRTVID
jgi:hypothetical protein